MKKYIITFLFAAVLLIAGCSGDKGDGKDAKASDDKLQVVTTYSVLYDIVKNVAGDLAEVHSLVPIGTDPHSYDPLPDDVQLTTDADIVFYNGFNLETGNSWFQNMIETAGKSEEDATVFRITKGIDPQLLKSGGHKGEPDPHAWLAVENGIKYAENARDALIKIDPDNKEKYEQNATKYIKKLEALEKEIEKKVAEIPEEKRVLVTSEGAFKYFSAAYGFHAAYIWEINAENEGTPDQIKSVVDLIKEKDIPGLFVETSVDPRSMETVSNETGVPIVGKIFTDSLGKQGEDGDTYIKMIEWNVDMITKGLTE
ncbi:metal ABC transporter substrate-binding protein [Virgibacillus dakarensis]|uniref:Manganese-binding lipoprotein MntA n=1 Tax=Lentibacillus populi TaxID=1827502 RepID=A0A9W5TWQ3_9BACI|nr:MULTISPECIES: metal ABC transporter substrate-binding protein [Bacillaceae]MBT2217882.1 metal ABC transporter substrate-binding protein [Virgibacillus dakarensis]MTW87562.1 metal ABC transporter substrate-binding protein [Virgibacillus dakarensis]GGB36020.1 manganese-binding lipoprotein MntA [Lentibacillus populi]